MLIPLVCVYISTYIKIKPRLPVRQRLDRTLRRAHRKRRLQQRVAFLQALLDRFVHRLRHVSPGIHRPDLAQHRGHEVVSLQTRLPQRDDLLQLLEDVLQPRDERRPVGFRHFVQRVVRHPIRRRPRRCFFFQLRDDLQSQHGEDVQTEGALEGSPAENGQSRKVVQFARREVETVGMRRDHHGRLHAHFPRQVESGILPGLKHERPVQKQDVSPHVHVQKLAVEICRLQVNWVDVTCWSERRPQSPGR